MMVSRDQSTGRPPDPGRTHSGWLIAIAPFTTFLAILIWYSSASGCWGDAVETSSYCEKVVGWLGDGLGLIVMSCMFLAIGLAVSAILGGLVSWLLGRMPQTVSSNAVIVAEIAVELVIGALPFLLIVFGST
ncbi:MAG: hypothetical protein ACM3MF_04860 [Anaerolineae bacterium]